MRTSINSWVTCSPTCWIARGRFTTGRMAADPRRRLSSREPLLACRAPITCSTTKTSPAFCGVISFIDVIPARFRQAMLDKNITRLVKSDNGGPTFETISDVEDVIKLAGRAGSFDAENEFGVSADRVGALDRTTQLAIAAGIDALRDAGIPLVMRYKTTSKNTKLPDRWGLPDELRDETGVIFGSAFPGLDAFADEMARYYADHARREQLALLESVRARAVEGNGNSNIVREIDRRIEELRSLLEKEPYIFERHFLLRTLSMGHSQFAEFIGARGPNTQI